MVPAKDQPADYVGIFHAHWEAAGPRVEVGRRLFGLLAKYEYWDVLFPSDFDMDQIEFGDMWAPRYRLRFRGEPGPKGSYGHLDCANVRSMCRRFSSAHG